MDPIGSIKPVKDSSFAMLLEAARRNYELCYFEQSDVMLKGGSAMGQYRPLEVREDTSDFYTLGQPAPMPLGDLDVILMRKDPPFDMEYIYTTYILDRAVDAGALVVNAPQALRDMNEKAYTAWFPDFTPDAVTTRSIREIKSFWKEHGTVVIKPLDGMGGKSIFVVRPGDNNANVIFETLTNNGSRFAIAQTYIPEISDGDKRILIVDGEPVPYALARVPPPDDNRGNLVMGATGRGQPLSERDLTIATEVGKVLKQSGVVFAGIDVIGDCLTEVNVTSPTGIRELDRQFDLNIAGQMFDAIEARLGR